ncbi:MAG: hypothetical protein KDI50_09085 [Candidatus Competibacteraceae bacterium]|nr:hypothetical protein [Candidatus Competibacteraceae bacterium]
MNNLPPRDPLLINLSVAAIAAGALLLLFVFVEVYSAYTNLQENVFVAGLSTFLTDAVLIRFPEKPIILGPAGARIAAVFLFLGMASMGVSAAMGLIKLGFHGFTPDLQQEFIQIKRKLDALQWKQK